MDNVLDLQNWIVMGQASLKMLGYFWPVVLLAIGWGVWETRQERRRLQSQPVRAESESANPVPAKRPHPLGRQHY